MTRLDTPQDTDLVRRCLAGEKAAWEALYQRYHDRLRRTIGRLLGPVTRDGDQAEEMAQEVWLSLVQNGWQRLRNDPRRGHFFAYLATLARQYVQQDLRRRARQTALWAAWPAVEPADNQPLSLPDRIVWEEFLATLTGPERHFVQDRLAPALPGDKGRPAPLTANQSKLKKRVFAKLRALLGPD